jgi:hypothetical protein
MKFLPFEEQVRRINALFPKLPKSPIKRTFSHDQANKPFIEIGAQVVCPNQYCRRPIATFVENLYQGQIIRSRHLYGPGIHPGGEMKCASCNMPWFLAETGQIHLKSGWLPKY